MRGARPNRTRRSCRGGGPAPGDLFTPTFAVSRAAGWTSHVLEQVGNNRLIRPEAEYTGPAEVQFVHLKER